MISSSFRNRDRLIGAWLLGVAFMVFCMVILGGLTRLTGSGLSMVDWKPVTGWLPPLSIDEWQDMFGLYKQSPQYVKVNFGMSLAEFQNIFWLEFLHRLWGRLIGLAFAAPLVFFLIKGWVQKPMILPLCSLFILGGAQGVLGWYMVKSGLVDDPEVSQYRLMAHLGFAFVLYGALIWAGLYFYKRRSSNFRIGRFRRSAFFLWVLAFVTILAGALVAGLDAGLTYNTFPLMDGDLIPNGLMTMSPWFLNSFENITMVQFQHRILGLVTAGLTLLLLLKYRSCRGVPHNALWACALLVLIQVGLGIATLVMVVPIGFASAHQACGLLLFTAFTWLNFDSQS